MKKNFEFFSKFSKRFLVFFKFRANFFIKIAQIIQIQMFFIYRRISGYYPTHLFFVNVIFSQKLAKKFIFSTNFPQFFYTFFNWFTNLWEIQESKNVINIRHWHYLHDILSTSGFRKVSTLPLPEFVNPDYIS